MSLEDLVALELEIDPAQQPDRRLVVDDQDPGRRMTPGIPHRRECNGAASPYPAPYPRFSFEWQGPSQPL